MAENSIRVGHDELIFKVTSEESGGALIAVDAILPACGGPPFLHRHAAAEVYRVERGELAIYLGDAAGGVRRIAAGAGDVVHIAGGREHTVRNESAAEAGAYVVFAPGAEFERFARAASELASPDEVPALAERHGIEMTRPVPVSPSGRLRARAARQLRH